MGPTSLVSMVQNTIGRNISNLQDLGDISYDLARPILKQVTNPEHLRALELASPQFADHDAELWRAFMARDIPDWRSKLGEGSNRAWFRYEVYCKLKKKEESEQTRQEEELRMAMMKIDKTKQANKSQFIHKVIQQDVARLPEYADGQRNPMYGRSNNTQNRGPSLRNAKSGSHIISALRKKSRDAAQLKRLDTTASVRPKMEMKPQQKSNSPPTTKMSMTKLKDRESRGERSLRLALESKEKEERELQVAERDRRRAVKQATREQRSKESDDQVVKIQTHVVPPPAPVQRPATETTPPRPSRTPSPFKSTTPLPTTATPSGPSVLPASLRRPVSIFAPKLKRRV